MATQAASPAAILPSAQVVGNAFVEQYYHILHQSPELVHKFYQDSSILSRPDTNGLMSSVTTMQAIDEKIQSLDYKNYKAEIKTADAQDSYQAGVIVLVTGCLTGKDNIKRKFAQTFFLAPQEKGYFVQNDVFRYVEESMPIETTSASVEDIVDSSLVEHAVPNAEATHVSDNPTYDSTTNLAADDINNGPEVCDPEDIEGSGSESGLEEEVVDEPVPVQTIPNETIEGHSIYVRNLPMNATVPQLEEEFKRFGPIKSNGIQVRSNKQQVFCFGFVEFESLDSMQSAIKVVVEEKRTTTRVGSGGRGRYTSGRGGGGFRGRGGYFGGRSFGRNEFRYQGEFPGRSKGPAGRNSEVYQRVDQNGGGRYAHQPNKDTESTH
ncbi:Nuclear transport factor 2 [Cynara cardunculus var. scolymus]|uniref:Nuclear transport factor 2 n=1 Tax=Cynara cardunculus var. scolymus TaxID=59895 RepID=A0A103QDF4_CYNCS|nr:Nuclear transport factor 2 [Cynara cardunculus var. scolymus]